MLSSALFAFLLPSLPWVRGASGTCSISPDAQAQRDTVLSLSVSDSITCHGLGEIAIDRLQLVWPPYAPVSELRQRDDKQCWGCQCLGS